MDFECEIEQIQNGYIVADVDSDKGKRFFNSIERLVDMRILKELEKEHREHKPGGEKLIFKFSLMTKVDEPETLVMHNRKN